MGWRITVDTGGTFTDVVVADPDGRFTIAKALTTPARIFEGMGAALDTAAERLATSTRDLLGRADILIYGTTRATNAIVTGDVAKTALLLTEGFPDVLVIKEGGKFDAHDFSRPYPAPYIPRRHTFEIAERVDAEGEVVRPLDEAQARRVLERVQTRGFEAVAVSLLWSIANPAHERRLGDLVEELLPGVPYTLSHELNPILREYRRTSSAAIDASIKPLMQAHLQQMKADLRDAGFGGEILVSTTVGGCLDIDGVAERPIHTVRSGPAMAPVAARTYAEREASGDTALVIDTGGTTFDVGLVRDGEIVSTQETWLGERFTGHLLGVPAVDVRSVGAGGGSIAWIDEGGLLRVGPQSAGAEPGPACYGRGGDAPTVTDAALLLGYLDPDYFLGGRMPLDPEAARRVFARLSDTLGVATEEVAFSVLSVANETMINAIKEITVSEGVDPSDAVLVAGGGAAGLGILPIARELDCRQVVLPRTASVLSACGMQFSNIVVEQAMSGLARSGDFDRERVNAILDRLDAWLEGFAAPLEARGFHDHAISYSVDAHYAAQVWELDVALPARRFASSGEVEKLTEAFHRAHERVFAVADPDSEIEFLNWKARLVLRLDHPRATHADPGAPAPAERRRRAWFDLERPHEARVVRGEALAVGERVEGPALLEEETTTLVVPPGMSAELTPHGSFVVDVAAVSPPAGDAGRTPRV